MPLYLDSSAIVKLIIAETGSAALREVTTRADALLTSALARIEVTRAVNRHAQPAIAPTRAVFDRLELIAVDDVIVERATTIEPVSLRTLDAIHVASAASLGADLDALVTYDRRMADAAVLHGMTALAPA